MMKQFLLELLNARVSGDAHMWFRKALEATVAPVEKNKLLGHYTAASLKLGKAAVSLTGEEQSRSQSLNPLPALDHWGLDEIGRAVFLLSLDHLPAYEYYQVVLQCYESGDSREQQSWLRALSLLPEPERFLNTAIDACRTNILPLFESIACENPYPSLYFPDLNFNQMVLKSLFNGIALARIVGLKSRFNPELSRMADDYASEREAAGREVPADIWLALAPRSSVERLQSVYRYLHHASPQHRYWAAVSLGFTHTGRSREALEKRRNMEAEQEIVKAIDASLARMAQ